MEAGPQFGIVILAAGNSSRLGRPKQLLPFHNKTLIRRMAESALEVASGPVVVVTGSSSAEVESEISDLSCHTVHNEAWPQGMGLSVATGIQKLMQIDPDIEGAILLVSDQPFVEKALLKVIIELARQQPGVIGACSYADTIGTPVLFPKSHFPHLLELTGQEGAKKLLKRFHEQVISIPFPQGAVDIDTPDDYERLLNSKN